MFAAGKKPAALGGGTGVPWQRTGQFGDSRSLIPGSSLVLPKLICKGKREKTIGCNHHGDVIV